MSAKHDLGALEVLLERAQQRAKLGWLPVPQEAATVFDALPDLIAAVKAHGKLVGYVAALMDEPDSPVAQQLVIEAYDASSAALRPFYGTER